MTENHFHEYHFAGRKVQSVFGLATYVRDVPTKLLGAS